MNNKKKYIIFIGLVLVVLIGVSFAFFNYYKVGANSELIAGDIYLNMDETGGYITLTNIFPETAEEARSRTDNTVTFTIDGRNTTTNKEIWYEIIVDEGNTNNSKIRFDANDLVFDLVEVGTDGTETYLVDSMSFMDIDARRIWVDKVASNKTDYSKTYRLRVWLSDSVMISDTNPDADYPAKTYKNYYASVKVSVFGDFEEKALPYNYMTRSIENPSVSGVNIVGFWPTVFNDSIPNVKTINFVSLEQEEIDTRYGNATVKADMSDATKGGNVKAWLETDTSDSTKYVMYVASDGITIFPEDSSLMFFGYNNKETKVKMFFDSLTTINFQNINTKYVTSMEMMFVNRSLTSLDLNNFDTRNVINMDMMFANCLSLTSLDLSNFDTRNVENMVGMFYQCAKLTSLDVSTFDTSKVTSMLQMFWNCSSLTSLDLSNFDTRNVTTMYGMFVGCSGLTSLDVSSFNTQNVTEMTMLFNGCSNLTSLDVSNFDTKNVKIMSAMFGGCSKLKSLILSNFDTQNVTNMYAMFAECSNLINLDISSFIFNDTLKGTASNYTGIFNLVANGAKVIVNTASEQTWILGLNSTDRPSAWTTSNVVVKS